LLHEPRDDQQGGLLGNWHVVAARSEPLLQLGEAGVGQEVGVETLASIALAEALKSLLLVLLKRATRQKPAGRKAAGHHLQCRPARDSVDRCPRAIVCRTTQDIFENGRPFGDPLLGALAGRRIVVMLACRERLGDLKRGIPGVHPSAPGSGIVISIRVGHAATRAWVRGLESNQRLLGPKPSLLPLKYPGTASSLFTPQIRHCCGRLTCVTKATNGVADGKWPATVHHGALRPIELHCHRHPFALLAWQGAGRLGGRLSCVR